VALSGDQEVVEAFPPQGADESVRRLRSPAVVSCWEIPPAADTSWRVPIADVEQAIRDACRRWTVREIVCDPFRWARTYQTLEAEGLPIVEYPQAPQRTVPGHSAVL